MDTKKPDTRGRLTLAALRRTANPRKLLPYLVR